ncbi:hypothetical protein ACVWW2_008506 [Bradyrhizobium sp. LM4.3]
MPQYAPCLVFGEISELRGGLLFFQQPAQLNAATRIDRERIEALILASHALPNGLKPFALARENFGRQNDILGRIQVRNDHTDALNVCFLGSFVAEIRTHLVGGVVDVAARPKLTEKCCRARFSSCVETKRYKALFVAFRMQRSELVHTVSVEPSKMFEPDRYVD